jgi:hypothetical protein
MLLSNFLNEFRLRHQLRHVFSPAFESVRDYVSLIRGGGILAAGRDLDLLVLRAQMAALGCRRSGADDPIYRPVVR